MSRVLFVFLRPEIYHFVLNFKWHRTHNDCLLVRYNAPFVTSFIFDIIKQSNKKNRLFMGGLIIREIEINKQRNHLKNKVKIL